MSKMTNIIYTLETSNLQTKIILFPDQQKSLKQVNGS